MIEPGTIGFPSLGGLRLMLPQLVIFDVDGTLQDSGGWWPSLCAQGLADFGAGRGLSLPVPDAEYAYSLIGKPDSGVWPALLPPEHEELWPELRDFLVAREVELLRSGVDRSFVGTEDVLQWLRIHGVKIALASNCRQSYFDAMLEGQGLARHVDHAFCLDSEGVETKSDMVRLALERRRTRDALMIGDRESDAEAARANEIPFVHRVGFHAAGELDCDATIASQHELIRLLLTTTAFWRDVLKRSPRSSRIAVTGCRAVGRGIFGRRLAGLSARPLLDLRSHDACIREGGEALRDELARRIRRSDSRAVVLGAGLEHPELRGSFDLWIRLEAPPETLEARLRALGEDTRGPGSWSELDLRAWSRHLDALGTSSPALRVDHAIPAFPRAIGEVPPPPPPAQ